METMVMDNEKKVSVCPRCNSQRMLSSLYINGFRMIECSICGKFEKYGKEKYVQEKNSHSCGRRGES